MKKLFFKYIIFGGFLYFFCFGTVPLYGQSLRKPTPQFSYACASASFNSFDVNFLWDPPLVNANNEFILELSDASGSFSNATQVASTTTNNNTFEFEFEFSFPTDTYGTDYRLRVRSTNPARTSPESDAFEAYYTISENLVINNLNGTEVVCDGSNYLLQVNNHPNESGYRWYRNNSLLVGETDSELWVTQTGNYFVEVDYGVNCSSSTFSNLVTVQIESLLGLVITGNDEIDVCANNDYMLTASIDNPSFLYRWYKDGVLIAGPAYLPSYVINSATPEGNYSVEIEKSNGCMELSPNVTATTPTINVQVTSATEVMLLPTLSETLSVSTTAQNPSYEWYRDGVAVPNSNISSLDITEVGVYNVVVTENVGSCVVTESSAGITVAYPQDFAVVIDTIENYSDCTFTNTQLIIEDILATHPFNGEQVSVISQLANQFSYQWYRDGNMIANETNANISIVDPQNNGAYTVMGSLSGFVTTSNSFMVLLMLSDTININSDASILCDGDSTAVISADSQNANYTYSWYRDGNLLTETQTTLVTNVSGNYMLGATAYGCTIFSNMVTITSFNEGLVTVNADETIFIVEGGSQNITASGADSYVWYFNDVVVSTSNVVMVNEEGNYRLVATLGTCETTRLFTAVYQENAIIPNVISPNGDGINDQWIIPAKYASSNDVVIYIYDFTGKIVFQTNAYQNNWPQDALSSYNKRAIFYYKIEESNIVLKRGTISVIR